MTRIRSILLTIGMAIANLLLVCVAAYFCLGLWSVYVEERDIQTWEDYKAGKLTPDEARSSIGDEFDRWVWPAIRNLIQML
jgi:hypothetical protein